MKTTDEVLKERGAIYGDFTDGASLEAAMMNMLCNHHETQTGRTMSALNKVFFSNLNFSLSNQC